MKKIIAVIDAMHFSEEHLDGFLYVAKEAHGKLTVILLEGLLALDMPIEPFSAYQYEQKLRESLEERERLREQNAERIYRACESHSENICVYEPVCIPLHEVVTVSRFADFLLINKSTSFAFLYESNPPRFVKDVLAEAQCPVMVLPDQIIQPGELVFSYNGTFSSMFAIRQFSQLFPDMSNMPVNVVYVAEVDSNTIPKENLLKDYLDHHYNEVKYVVLNGEPVAAIRDLLVRRKNCIVTYGAYGRSRLSRFFHRSDAESILRAMEMPVFITHP